MASDRVYEGTLAAPEPVRYTQRDASIFLGKGLVLPICPKCGKALVRLVRPRGVLERVASWLSYSPYHCQLCRHHFRAFRAPRSTGVEDRRAYERIPVMCPAFYSGSRLAGRGLIVDVSMGGCWITAEQLPKIGETLGLDIYDAEDQTPIRIDGAVVRLTIGQGFACEFVRMMPEQEERLRGLVERSWPKGRA